MPSNKANKTYKAALAALIILGIPCAWFGGLFYSSYTAAGADAGAGAGAGETKLSILQGPAQFFPIDRFVFSINDTGESHLVLLDIALQSKSADAQEKLIGAEPLIKNELMKMFTKKSLDEIQAKNSVDQLQTEAFATINSALEANNFKIQLDNLIFTRMILQ